MSKQYLVSIAAIFILLAGALVYFSSQDHGVQMGTTPVPEDLGPESVAGSSPASGLADRVTKPVKNTATQGRSYNSELSGQEPQYFAQNHNELWATLNDDDRAVIESFSRKYFDSLQFYTQDQYEWMVRRGYPTPAAIIAAQGLSQDELAQLSQDGNIVAALLGADRLVDEMVELKSSMEGDDSLKRKYFELLVQESELAQVLQQSGSPLAGYHEARKSMEFSHPDLDTEAATVKLALMGLAYAEQQGDTLARNRAAWLADTAGVDMELYRYFLSYGKLVQSMATDPTYCYLPPKPMPQQVIER